MNEKKLIELVSKCEAILERVESKEESITQMHEHMKLMIGHNQKLQADLKLIQQDKMQKLLITKARKAAKKAAKKSLAKAKIREMLRPEGED